MRLIALISLVMDFGPFSVMSYGQEQSPTRNRKIMEKKEKGDQDWVPWDCPESQMVIKFDSREERGSYDCDSYRFYFGAWAGYISPVDWHKVIDDTLPWKVNERESERLIGWTGRLSVNPMIVLAHVLAAPDAYGIDDLAKGKIDKNFLKKMEEIVTELMSHSQELESKVKKNRQIRPEVEAIKMLLGGNEEKEALFKDAYQKMSKHESILSVHDSEGFNPFVSDE